MIKIILIFCLTCAFYKESQNANFQTSDDCIGYSIEPEDIVRNGHLRVKLEWKGSCDESANLDSEFFVIAYKERNKNENEIKREIQDLLDREIKDPRNPRLISGDSLYLQQISKSLKYPNWFDFDKLDMSSKYRVGILSRNSTGLSLYMKKGIISVNLVEKQSNIEVILIIVLAILLFITFILLGVLLYINYAGDNRWQNVLLLWSKSERRQLIRRDITNGYDQSYRCSTLSFGSFHEQEFEIKSHSIELNELSDTIPLMIESGILKQEFSSVFRGQLMKWDYGKQVQHKAKNRYGNLLPYDHSRVVLDVIDNDVNTDYINANYVDGYQCPNRYVATQGPLNNTINDMWRMIWQLDCHQIVMLTSLDEGGKNKCDKYWPDDTCTYGVIKITLTKTEIFADYIIRTFSGEKEGIVKKLVLYHFISWPDHTVPMYSCSLLTFIGRVRSSDHYNRSQPIVVHCSAGVGRTGTFILIDAMLEMAKNEKQIDVLKHFCVIRQQRINLVEKLGQYVFVHQALLEALSHELTSIDCSDFHNYFTKLTTYDNNSKLLPLLTQFQILNKLSPQVMNTELCQSARAHPHLNRNQDIIPPDFARVILPGNDDYINAVYINGYKRRDAYIVTQVPLESSQVHFWQMMASTSTKTIVLLNDIKQDNQIYWPTMNNKELVFNENKLTVLLISEEHHNNVTIRIFHLPQSDITIKQFHLKGWPSLANKPSTQQTIIDLMEMMEQWNLQSNSTSIVVQCFLVYLLKSDGNHASGVFCATTFLCDRIKEEQQVDVFLAVQTVRTNRPQFITDLDQYKFLHQLAICYLQHFDTYANFK